MSWVWIMKNGLSQIIVNIECQKDEPSAYQILNRAIFYVSRLVSSQKERDFVNTNYDDIKQVFSIWICMNMYKKGYSLEQIADVTEIDVDAIETIIEKNDPVLV